MKERLRTELTGKSVAVTCDGWLSPVSIEFLTMCAHYFDVNWVQRTCCLMVVDMRADTTASNLHSVMASICSLYNIKPVAFTCDQGRNYTKAVDMFIQAADPSESPLKCVRYICCAHNLNLVMGDAFKTSPDSHDTPNYGTFLLCCVMCYCI